jgi:hypothetical protein
MEPLACRRCGATVPCHQLEALGRPPVPGDLAICHICGDVTIFEKDGVRRTARYSDAEGLSACVRQHILEALDRRPN